MRLRTSILLMLLILGFCTLAYASSTGEAGDIAEPSITGANMDVPAPHISAPNMDMPSPHPKPLAKQKSKSNNSNSTTNKNGTEISNSTQTSEVQKKSEQMNVSGKWIINFIDSADKTMNLNIWSASGNVIMGFGTMTDSGVGTSIAASGSINSNELQLIAKYASPASSGTKENEYDLDLFMPKMTNSTLSGTYIQKSGGQFLAKGNATAVRQ